MPEPKLLTDSRDGVLTLTLNRPEKHNAIDNDLARSLLQALDAAYRANPNRFKNKPPRLPPMPVAAWINPPPQEKVPNSETHDSTLN